mgnify:FL=1
MDHAILLERLQCWFGFTGSALDLISSYLSQRTQSVLINGVSSASSSVHTGVPQGSVLGPVLFTLYTTPIANLIGQRGLSYHLYADDTQIYLSFAANDAVASFNLMSSALESVNNWFHANRLSLNPGKTEFLLIGTPQQRNKICEQQLLFCNNVLKSVDSARNLGVIFDSNVSLKKHVSKVCQLSFMHIRQLRHVKHSLDRSSVILLANALVSSRLDYCNSLYYGLPDSTLKRLQYVQNSLARVVTSSNRYDHITPVLRSLHWLPVRQRVTFKIATLTYKIMSNNQPSYLSELIKPKSNVRTLRSSNMHLLAVPARIKSENGRRSFAFAAPTVWNSLPLEARSATSLCCFRRLVKTHLFPP